MLLDLVDNVTVRPLGRFSKAASIFGLLGIAIVLCCCGPLVDASQASPGVWWSVGSGSWPGFLPSGGSGKIIVTAQNRGFSTVNAVAEPVVVRDVLPAGLEARAVEGVAGKKPQTGGFRGLLSCPTLTHHEVVCEFNSGVLPPYEQLEIKISVKVLESAVSGESNTASVLGGGATSEKTVNRPIRVVEEGQETPFGIENFEMSSEEEDGVPSFQAAKHPFQFTGVVSLNAGVLANNPENQEPAGLARDLTIQLPPGVLGNPTAFPQCTAAEFTTVVVGEIGTHNTCPPQTAIGVANVTFNAPGNGPRFDTRVVPVFNLTPQPGEPARFGFEVINARAYLTTSVRTGSDYGVTLRAENIPELVGFLSSKVTFWGVPGEAVHDSARGWACILGEATCTPANDTQPVPFLSLPPSCTGPMRSTVQADSWAEPEPADPEQAPLFSEYLIGGLEGCNLLQFKPEIQVAPDVPNASTPTGLGVTVHVPQTATLNPKGLGESVVRNTTVALPEGVSVNPGGADGLEACSTEMVGFLGKEPGEPDQNLFTGLDPTCPNAAKVGTLEIETPLLPNALKGAVYLAAQNSNPFGSLLAMYLVAQDPVSGTLVKLAGEVKLTEGTGQLISTFKNTPQLPFENLKLHFFGESRAPLGTPALCGPYTTVASFAPWSGSPPTVASSTFNIGPGPNGAPCANPLPFAPSLTAGSTNIQAGAFTPFTTTVSREDGNQDIHSIQLHLPAGLSGTLSSVELCPEPQASQGTCGPNSLVGETTVSVGLGGNPYSVRGGRVYITGPYKGAPFGLSIVNPAKAGPFDLGKGACDCVLVRARIEVDPTTAELTITTDQTGPNVIPTMLDGIPLQIKHVNVIITRPGFTFNPTNCNPLHITATLTSTQNITKTLTVPFQATNCATLAFKPQLTATVSGKNSRKNGASLHVKLTYPKAPWGTQTNIAKVKVDLPKRLPSRLTTLQKACTDKVFEQNPASCPPASRVGTAHTTTPIIPVPLTGPAYFVSHGGAKFPELIIVLQGYGVTVNLHGETFISKAGITSSTFRTVPDVPVNTFELTLPQGPNSALAANGNLCKTKLTIPTAFTAQNGQTTHKPTKITTTNCPKTRKHKTTHKHKKKH
jgi:hypothetical protein